MKKNADTEAQVKQTVESAAEQILSAGKAAVETAQEAVDKAQEAVERIQSEGGKLFDSLSKEGQKLAEQSVEEMRSRLEDARGRATDTFDHLEKIFEERVSRALGRLGIPSHEDFQSIANRLEELNKSVRALIREERVEEGVKKVEQVTSEASLDNLKQISGVGPTLEAKLNQAGFTTYRQIAELDAAGIERLDALVKSGRIAREDWVGQAKDLHFKKYHERI